MSSTGRTTPPDVVSPNFAFLAAHDSHLVRFAAQAERYFGEDPAIALIKLRLFAESLAQHAAAYSNVVVGERDGFIDVLNMLWDRGVLTPETSQLFHGIRKAGNRAVHEDVGTQREALYQLKMARRLAVWFHKSFKHRNFKAGPFVPPPDPKAAETVLLEELETLRAQLANAEADAEEAVLTAEEEARIRTAADARAATAYQEVAAAMALAEETEELLEAERGAFEERLALLRAEVAKAPVEQTEAVVETAREAGTNLDLDEADTRRLIDQQLRDAGWVVDSEVNRYSKGVRPTKGKNMAIAEWPTASGPADYVLFVGLKPVAIVEAKRKAVDVSGRVGQAQRYSRDFELADGMKSPGGPWGDYKIPFVFATNGRPFLRQMLTRSGIWFRDVRRSVNHSRALEGWRTPEGLEKLLRQDVDAANEKLTKEPNDYLPLRDYQQKAIEAAEKAVADGRQEILIAMATGTGKTRACICLVYRLLKAGRFNRVLFLVDRTFLGNQAHDSFKNVKLEQLQSFTDIYDVKGLGDIVPEPDTRLHFATVEGMVKRVLYTDDEDPPVPVDQYDCIVIDECHRGYNLDRELSDTELTFRSETDYISKYRRVLDHFDAVKIGLTATPAFHTTEIFKEPVYTYSYRQAVIDGWLIDHEPPIRIVTKLAKDGIRYDAGEEMTVLDVQQGELDLVHAPDEVTFEIEQFNESVLNENFNRVVCERLARHIDPGFPEKTLIFCARDSHCDTVVHLLKEVLAVQYGEIDDDVVMKITGATDRPRDAFLRFKNESNPKIAVTVDLLTTGIDVPAISNIVFLRRVRSRILYEQMMGRATRRCDEIGKEVFHIFDAVDLYSALLDYTDMKPVVQNPKISFEQMVDELATLEGEEQRAEVCRQIVAKLQSKKKRFRKARLEEFETLAGKGPEELLSEFTKATPGKIAEWLADKSEFVGFLDRVVSEPRRVVISDHLDELVEEARGYGAARKPGDYLLSFTRYLEDNLNRIPALMVVTQRPRELTRQQLKTLKIELDQAGFNEMALRTAWREMTNEDIAASIIGYIRRAALGSPLVPYEKRVETALKRILASRAWTNPQRKWLERIGKQLKVETIVDRSALDRGQFKAQGGFNRLNKVFDGQLEQVLGEINEELWKDAG